MTVMKWKNWGLREDIWKNIYHYVLQEFDDCTLFVEHNIELIQCETGYRGEEDPHTHMEHMQSRWTHQEEVDRLKTMKKKCEE